MTMPDIPFDASYELTPEGSAGIETHLAMCDDGMDARTAAALMAQRCQTYGSTAGFDYWSAVVAMLDAVRQGPATDA